MKVLCVTSMYPPHHLGGYELSCRDVMERLARGGDDVEVLSGDVRIAAAGERATVPVRRDLRLYFDGVAPISPGLRDALRIERHNRDAVRRALDEVQPDVVSVWQVAALSLGVLGELAERAVPLAFFVCDDWLLYAAELDPWARAFARLGIAARALEPFLGVRTAIRDLGAAGPFLFVSDHIRDRAIEHGPWHLDTTSVVYSGVDLHEFGLAPDPGPAWAGRLICPARLDPRKGIATAIRALPMLDGATLEIHGQGDPAHEVELRELATSLGVSGAVTFTRSTRAELAERYRQADACIFPSVWDEPFGLVPVEAMASGTPVIATGTGGSGEFLIDGATCLRFPPDDHHELARAVRALADDEELRAHLVHAGLRCAADLSIDRLVDQVRTWHSWCIDRTSPRPSRRVLRAAAEPVHPRRLRSTMTTNPITAHERVARDVINHSDADAIRGLYRDLGDVLVRTIEAADPTSVPVLSAPETSRAVVTRLAGSRGRVLDAGCGPNPRVAVELARDGATVVALDVAPGTVALARTVASAVGADLHLVVGDVEQLPFRDDAFDALVCDDTIEHVPDDVAAAAELIRVVRPEGRLVVATPNRRSLGVLRARLRDRWRGVRRPSTDYFVATSHLREYTWRELERLLADAELVARVGVGWDGGRRARVASALVRHWPFRELSQMILVEARPR